MYIPQEVKAELKRYRALSNDDEIVIMVSASFIGRLCHLKRGDKISCSSLPYRWNDDPDCEARRKTREVFPALEKWLFNIGVEDEAELEEFYETEIRPKAVYSKDSPK